MKITLDTNCLIDLELDEGAVNELRHLVILHDLGKLSLQVPAIGASERMKDGAYAPNFSVFQERVRKLAQREIELLKPILYWGIGYWGWAIWSGKELNVLHQKIHDVLFPGTEFEWQAFATAHGINAEESVNQQTREWKSWRNRKCDTLAMWCHIHYKGDIFVTRDANFLKPKKKNRLIQLGAKSVMSPAEALAQIG